MILADISPSSAPDQIKPWLECLFWFIGVIGALIWIAKTLRGPAAHPPNEILGHASAEIERRVHHLEEENTKVWVNMEKNRVEALERAGELNAAITGLGASLEAAVNNVNLMKIAFDQWRKK